MVFISIKRDANRMANQKVKEWGEGKNNFRTEENLQQRRGGRGLSIEVPAVAT
jgi:hypothetical protein